MAITHLAPSPELRPWVGAHHLADHRDDRDRFVIGAQAHSTLLIPEHFEYEYAGPLASRMEMGPLSVLGPHDAVILARAHRPIRGLTVTFTAFGASAVLGVPQRGLTNRLLDVAGFIDARELNAVADEVHSGATAAQKVAAVERWLRARLARGANHGIAAEVLEAARLLTRAPSLGEGAPEQVDRIARHVGWSPRQLRRRFAEAHGLSPKRFELISRINLACRALREGEPSLERLAYGFGFSDYAHFSRAFRALTGASPRAFARSPEHAEHAVLAAAWSPSAGL